MYLSIYYCKPLDSMRVSLPELATYVVYNFPTQKCASDHLFVLFHFLIALLFSL